MARIISGNRKGQTGVIKGHSDSLFFVYFDKEATVVSPLLIQLTEEEALQICEETRSGLKFSDFYLKEDLTFSKGNDNVQ